MPRKTRYKNLIKPQILIKREREQAFKRIIAKLKPAFESPAQRLTRLAITKDYRQAGRTPEELGTRLAEELITLERVGISGVIGSVGEESQDEKPPLPSTTLPQSDYSCLTEYEEDVDESFLKRRPEESLEAWTERLGSLSGASGADVSKRLVVEESAEQRERRRQANTQIQRVRRARLCKSAERLGQKRQENPETGQLATSPSSGVAGRSVKESRRSKESPEQRERRLQSDRQRQQARRARESAEEGERRRQANREYQRLKRTNETSEEQRERSLQLGRQRNREIIAEESAEQRERRLEYGRQRNRERIADERAEQRERRLEYGRQRSRARIAAESAEERATRLRKNMEGRRQRRREMKGKEPAEVIAARNERKRERDLARRSKLSPEELIELEERKMRSREKSRARKAELAAIKTPAQLLAERVAKREQTRLVKEMEAEEWRLFKTLEVAEDPAEVLQDPAAQKVVEWLSKRVTRMFKAPTEVKEWRKAVYAMMKSRPADESPEERKTRLAANSVHMKEYYEVKMARPMLYHMKNKEELNAYSRLYAKQKWERMTEEEREAHKIALKKRQLEAEARKKASVGPVQRLGPHLLPPDALRKSYQRRPSHITSYQAIAPPRTRRPRGTGAKALKLIKAAKMTSLLPHKSLVSGGPISSSLVKGVKESGNSSPPLFSGETDMEGEGLHEDDGHMEVESSNEWTSLSPSFESPIPLSTDVIINAGQFGNKETGISEGFGYAQNQTIIAHHPNEFLSTSSSHQPHHNDHEIGSYPASYFYHPGGGGAGSSDLNALIMYQQQQQQQQHLQQQQLLQLQSWNGNNNLNNVELPLNYSLHSLPNSQVPLVPQMHTNIQPSSSLLNLGGFGGGAGFIDNNPYGSSLASQTHSNPSNLFSSTKKRKPRKRQQVGARKNKNSTSNATTNATNAIKGNKSVENAPEMGPENPPVPPAPNPLHEKFEKYYLDKLCPKCPHCPMTFKSQPSFQRHIKTHDLRNLYTCQVCSTGFTTTHRLGIHIWFGHYARMMRYECRVCDKKYFRRTDLRQHMETTHSIQDKSSLILGVRNDKKEFRCNLCPAEFTGFLELNQHMTSVHKSEFTHFCKYCGIMLRIKDHLTEHVLRFHSDEAETLETAKEEEEGSYFICQVCDNNFLNKDLLVRHRLAVHHQRFPQLQNGKRARKLSCPSCDTKFMTERRLSCHVLKNCPLRNKRSCYSCQACFQTQDQLHSHIQLQHSQSQEDLIGIGGKQTVYSSGRYRQNRFYKCELCHQSYLTLVSLRIHFTSDHEKAEKVGGKRNGMDKEPQGYQGKGPEGESLVTLNNSDRNSEVLLEMNVVDGAQEIQEDLVSLSTENGSMGISCPPTQELGPSFAAIPAAAVNQISLNEDSQAPKTRHQCKHCMVNFGSKEFLEMHMIKKHSNPKNRTIRLCQICQTSFTSSEALSRHTKRFHDPNRKRIICPRCPSEFSRQEHLKGHIKRMHDNPNPYQKTKTIPKKGDVTGTSDVQLPFKCEICSKRFRRNDGLTDHLTTVHFQQHFSTFCEFCGKEVKRNYMINHIRKVHPEQDSGKGRVQPDLKKLPLAQILSLLSELESKVEQSGIGEEKRGRKAGAPRKPERSGGAKKRVRRKGMESDSEEESSADLPSDCSSSSSCGSSEESEWSDDDGQAVKIPGWLRKEKKKYEKDESTLPSLGPSLPLNPQNVRLPFIILRRCDEVNPLTGGGMKDRRNKKKCRPAATSGSTEVKEGGRRMRGLGRRPEPEPSSSTGGRRKSTRQTKVAVKYTFDDDSSSETGRDDEDEWSGDEEQSNRITLPDDPGWSSIGKGTRQASSSRALVRRRKGLTGTTEELERTSCPEQGEGGSLTEEGPSWLPVPLILPKVEVLEVVKEEALYPLDSELNNLEVSTFSWGNETEEVEFRINPSAHFL